MRSRPVDVIELEGVPRAASILPQRIERECGEAVSFEWVATATAEHPAVLRATLTNTNEFRAKFDAWSLPPPFGSIRSVTPTGGGRTYRDGIFLVPTGDHPLVDEGPEYERRSDEYWYATGSIPKQPDALWLDADESVSGEYYLLSRSEGDGIVPGVYWFGREHRDLGLSIWDPGRPGPVGESRFAGLEVPRLPRRPRPPGHPPDEMAWFHDANESTEVYLHPSEEEVTPPARLEFEFVNRSREAVEGNPSEWGLYKLHEGSWHLIEPSMVDTPLGWIVPGEPKRKVLFVFHGDHVRCGGGRPVGHLGGGRYAYSTGMDEARTHAVLFDLIADPVEVTPTEAIESVERDGDTLSAVSSRGDRSWEHGCLVDYSLTRLDDFPPGAEPRRLIAEQVLRYERRQLRDALGLLLAHDAHRVTLTEYAPGRTAFDPIDERFVEFDGEAYEIETEPVEE